MESIEQIISKAVGPAPWYWQTFPEVIGRLGSVFKWDIEAVQDGNIPCIVLKKALNSNDYPIVLAVNIYTRAFSIPPHYIGLWYPEEGKTGIVCFDPEDLTTFGISDIPTSSVEPRWSYHASVQPLAKISIDHSLTEGIHKIDVPEIFFSVSELQMVDSYNDPNIPYAIYVLYPEKNGLEVLPQRWFTGDKFDLGYEWITRVIRNPETGRIVGDGIRINRFELTEDGCNLSRWIG